jgi:hypothetical protein
MQRKKIFQKMNDFRRLQCKGGEKNCWRIGLDPWHRLFAPAKAKAASPFRLCSANGGNRSFLERFFFLFLRVSASLRVYSLFVAAPPRCGSAGGFPPKDS